MNDSEPEHPDVVRECWLLVIDRGSETRNASRFGNADRSDGSQE
jgi:hypothetical protein